MQIDLDVLEQMARSYGGDVMRLKGTQVEAIIAKVRELEQDAARLDWLDQAAHCADWVEGEPVKRVIRADDGEEFQGDTWRAAIDAARGDSKHG